MAANSPASALPPDAQTLFNRGLDRLKSGNWKDALSDFTEAIKLRPDVAVGYRFRAYAHADGGNVARAIADLDEAIRLNPDDSQSYYDRAQYFLRQKQYDEALRDCIKGLGTDGARADLIALRGRVHAARGASEPAEADFTKAIEIDPEGACDYLIWRGDLYLECDDNDKAIADFTEAINRKPENAYAYSRRASAHWAVRDTDAALADYAKAIQLDPEWPWVRNGRGLVYADRGEHEAAVADFNDAIRLNANHGPSYEYRGESLCKLGRKAEALADFNEAIRLNPDSARLHNRRAMFHYYNRDYGKAVRDHMEALKREPNLAATFNYLGWVYSTAPDQRVRNGRRALECATRACELTEWLSPGYLDTLAAAHAELGQWSDALKWVHKAVEVATDDDARDEYASRIDLFENRQPLRVTPEAGK
jgi:serine/threonine-protein kinase